MSELKKLLDERSDIELASKHYKMRLDVINTNIRNMLESEISAAYASKGNDGPYGTVHIERDGIKLKVTTPKRVEWDSDKLAAVADTIKNAGDNPLEYMKLEYSVSETAYKNWPSHIAEVFEPARTTKPGTVKIEVEE